MKRTLPAYLFIIALVGCQPVAPAPLDAAPPPPAAAPPPPAAAPPPPAAAPVSASTVIWGEVPRQICTCHEDALSRVETDLQQSQLPVDFNIESGNEGWHIFSVRFDPGRVAPEKVTQLLKGAGALIIPAPTGL